jgi:hypothetical protein
MTVSMHAPFSRRDQRRFNAFWLMEHCVGGRMTERLVGERRRRVRADQLTALEGHDGALLPVPRVRNQDVATFLRDHLAAEQPVVLEGAAAHWPCMDRWTPEFFSQRFGDEPIRLLQMGPEDTGAGRYESVETILSDALQRLEEGNRAYCRFLPTLMEYPEMQADLDMAWLRARRGTLSTGGNLHLFIGGAGTSTGLHSAVSTNLFVQVLGKKRWTLYSPSWTPLLEPPMDRAMYFWSTFDPEAPDYDAFPACRHLRGYEVELGPGDVLFNPPFWWHKVSNPTMSIGVGFRWFPPGPCYRASPIQWLLTYLSVNPPLWAGLRHKLDFTKIFVDRRF